MPAQDNHYNNITDAMSPDQQHLQHTYFQRFKLLGDAWV